MVRVNQSPLFNFYKHVKVKLVCNNALLPLSFTMIHFLSFSNILGSSNETKPIKLGSDAIPNLPFNMMKDLIRKKLSKDNLETIKNLLKTGN